MTKNTRFTKFTFILIMLLLILPICNINISVAATYEGKFEYELESGMIAITKYIDGQNIPLSFPIIFFCPNNL